LLIFGYSFYDQFRAVDQNLLRWTKRFLCAEPAAKNLRLFFYLAGRWFSRLKNNCRYLPI
jgi:hypothetical protein